MNAALILGAIAAVFGIATLLLRSNAVYVFLCLAVGNLLALLAAKDVTQIVNSIISVNVPTFSIVEIFLLVIAPVIVLIIYRKTAGASLILQIVPAAAAAVMLFMMITAFLPYDLQNNIQSSNLYTSVKPYYEFAVAAGLLFSVFWLWTKRPHHDKGDKKHKK